MVRHEVTVIVGGGYRHCLIVAFLVTHLLVNPSSSIHHQHASRVASTALAIWGSRLAALALENPALVLPSLASSLQPAERKPRIMDRTLIRVKPTGVSHRRRPTELAFRTAIQLSTRTAP